MSVPHPTSRLIRSNPRHAPAACVRRGVALCLLLSCAHGLSASPAPPSTNYWVFKPLAPGAPPAVKDNRWPGSPIDHFVLAKLEEKGLAPAPRADKATLLRRATFDLHGLPPAPGEIDAFVADTSADAFAKVVDGLLASPRYGERWGRHWLDLARFAESHGFEYDRMRDNAWPYRDYVIRSFNDDKPYAQFIQEQIAGDALEAASRDGLAATGFLVAGPFDQAGNTSASALLKARIREEELEDMIAAVGQTFLGLTINCARCHDHKFDPIPQADYYRMKAAFDGVRHGDRPWLTAAELKARDTRITQIKDRIRDLERNIAEVEEESRQRAAEVGRRRTKGGIAPTSAARVPTPLARWMFDDNANDSLGRMHGALEGGAVISHGRLRLDGKGAFVRTALLPQDLREKTLEAWVVLSNRTQRGGGVVSLETKDGEVFDAIVFGERAPKKWMAGSSFFERTRDLTAPNEGAQADELIHVAVVYRADNSITVYRNGAPYGETFTPSGANASLRTYPAGESRLLIGLRHTGAGNGFLAGEVEEARLYDRALTAEEIAASARTGPLIVTAQDVETALNTEQREQREAWRAELAKQHEALKAVPPAAQVYAANSKPPEPTFVLARGDVEKKKEQVTAGGLSAVWSVPADFGLAAEAPEGLRRVKLAGWIASTNNPLTARVLVNRVWQHHFGRGIVGTPNDFGVNGERPSHPELLDWLAREFLAQGGSIKKLHRLIMTSATYQQASSRPVLSESVISKSVFSRAPGSKPATTDLLKTDTLMTDHWQRASATDADNRLLWHYPLRRLEAEAVRDAMLSVSGQLNPQLGGPSFRPFTVFVSNSHFYNLTNPTGPEYNRRTVYRAVVHSGKDPLLDSLDCPDPSTKTPVRGMTTTPIQALGMMNNSFVQRQTRHFADRLNKEAGESVPAQIKLGYRLAFGRAPNADELARTTELARHDGLESVCWVLLNASEFLYVK